MAAMAGALDIRLEKTGHYIINSDSRLPEVGDLVRGIRLAAATSITYLIFVTIFIIMI